MLKKKKANLLILLLALLSLFSACMEAGSPSDQAGDFGRRTDSADQAESRLIIQQEGDQLSGSAFLLNTYCTITLYDHSDRLILEEAFELCRHYEQLFSKTVEDSEIFRLNQQKSLRVSDDTADLLRQALAYCELSDGALDISIGSVSNLWDFNSGENIVPAAEQIAALLPSVDFRQIKITDHEVCLLQPRATLDLGAVAKGYIADRMKDYLVSQGVTQAILNLGGNVLCIGRKNATRGFSIGIQKPFDEGYFAAIELKEPYYSVVTSGIYERYFEKNGRFYHHILDPETGMPVDNDLLSVTIISADSLTGDALSTACFVLGRKSGMDLIDQLDDVYALFLTKDGQIYYSEGLQESLTVKISEN